jgi:hemoglobin
MVYGKLEQSYTVYELVGGRDTFNRLAAAFYRRVENDPVLRPMYPHDLWGPVSAEARRAGETPGLGLCSPVDRLAAFLAQFFGGPRAYSDERGHPRLKMRHFDFKIGQAQRDAWLTHMSAAIDEIGIEEPMRSLMRGYFDKTSTFLINQPALEGPP